MVKVVGEMGLKTLLDHGPASSPGMDVKFRSWISPACRGRRELGQPEGSREGPFARQSKSYYYATACSGSRGGAGAQRACDATHTHRPCTALPSYLWNTARAAPRRFQIYGYAIEPGGRAPDVDALLGFFVATHKHAVRALDVHDMP